MGPVAAGPSLATAATFGAVPGAPARHDDAATLAMPPGYTLVWADEFDRDGPPDPARWDHDTGMNRSGWHNREKQYYSAAGGGNAEVRAGLLLITARREQRAAAPDWGGQGYTSARLLTRGRAEWTYGFFEIRARLACGQGTWPAIWMLGSQGDWPASPRPGRAGTFTALLRPPALRPSAHRAGQRAAGRLSSS